MLRSYNLTLLAASRLKGIATTAIRNVAKIVFLTCAINAVGRLSVFMNGSFLLRRAPVRVLTGGADIQNAGISKKPYLAAQLTSV